MTERVVLCSPFAGYESAYMARWAQAYALMAERTGATAIWLDNSADEDFGKELRAVAEAMPIPVRIMAIPLRIGDRNTGPGKNYLVCANAQLLIAEAKRLAKDPQGHYFSVESDVFVPVGAPEQLLADLEAHPALAAVSGAVSEGGWMENQGTMAWRIQRKAAPSILPAANGHISWYEPEFRDGIELVDATPFGCLMVALETFDVLPPVATQFPRLGWDQEWGERAWAIGRPVAVDWAVRCEHHRNLVERDVWFAENANK